MKKLELLEEVLCEMMERVYSLEEQCTTNEEYDALRELSFRVDNMLMKVVDTKYLGKEM